MDEFPAWVLWRHSRPGFLIPILNPENQEISELPETIRRVHCIMAGLSKQAAAAVAEEVLEKLDVELGG